MSNFAEELNNIPTGEYLRIWGQFPGAMSPQCIQGKLRNVDTQAGKAFLESTTYSGQINEVPIGGFTSIQRGYTGSGASGPVQKPDKAFNPNSGEWQDKTFKDYI
ncbi:hypothetical protein [Pseudomonas sp. MWU13-2105]|uniref:hypothetical protein n=1 Tax=Pseudomonas sp. MWU13-2105 TaxID=2935074 RepID=UPI00200F5B7E|nr:hypothetical protein [Pseudomonas sp. MWU13-2105]